MPKSRFTRLALVAVVAAGLLAGCGGKKKKFIECTDPVDGQAITSADDTNATTPGIQIEVTCGLRGFEINDLLRLNVHNDIEDSDRDYSQYYTGTGTITISPVTLQGGTVETPGRYTLVANDEGDTVESNHVSVTVVAEEITCPNFDFIDPEDGESWNQDDDSNDDLSDGFQHDVVITTGAGDAESVTLYLNDALVGTGTVSGTLIEFSDVTFPSGGGDMTLRIQTTASCRAEATVTIDDASPTCGLAAPAPTDPEGWINATFDEDSGEAGMQADVVVETEDGATVELFIDTPLSGTPTGSATADTAGDLTFTGQDLPESDFGTLTIQVRCTDTAGNVGVSSLNSYGVDSLLPIIAITVPAGGELLNDTDDVDSTRVGIQINVTVDTDQPLGSDATIYPCAAGVGGAIVPDGSPTLDADGIGTGLVHLGGVDGDVQICADVTKESGNAATAAPVTVTIDTAMPQIALFDPDGTAPVLHADDVDTVTAGCQYDVLVDCDAVGYPVTFYDEIAGARGTGTCVADGASTLGGRATIRATLSEGSRVLYASITDGAGNTGESAHIPVTVKSTLPGVSWVIPSTCPTEFHAASSTTQMIRVMSNASPVTLTVTNSGSPVGASPYSQATSGSLATFSTVQFDQGLNTMTACATDAYGQEGCSTACDVDVHNVPTVTITTPASGARLGIDDDLDAAAGCQVNVTFTSDVAAGDNTELFVNTTSVGTQPYGASSVTYSSVTIPEGDSIPLQACATDTRGTGCRTINVTCDVTAPDAVLVLNSTVTNRRGGTIELSWTAPGDAGGYVAGYEIACSTTDITDTASFEAATPYSFTELVAAPGSPQTQSVTGLRIQRTHYCAIRSVDVVGNVSAVSPSTNQLLDFLSVTYTGSTGLAAQEGFSVTSLGDVNGDLVDDFAVGAFGNRVKVFLGSALSVPASPATTITAPSGVRFGARIASIGDFNGDTMADLAIADYSRNTNKGAVYIFLGRTVWPSTMTDSDADLTFLMDDPSSTYDDGCYFGWGLDSAGDFNNDGRSDLAIGAHYWNSSAGTVFIILGRNPMPAFGTVITVPGDRTTNFIGDFQITSPLASSRFGTHLSAAGPLNSDTYQDIIIGAPGGVTGVPMSGTAYMVYGRTSSGSGLTTIASPNITIPPPFTDDNRFGYRVSGIGDYNGDTYNDVAISSYYYPAGTDNRGVVFLYMNNGGAGPDSTVDATISNDASSSTGDWLAYSMARSWRRVGQTQCDVNMDGRIDLFFAPLKYGGADAKGFIGFGRTLLADFTLSTADVSLASLPTSGGQNAQVSFAGDIDDDGFVDLLIGNPLANTSDGGCILYY